MFENQHCRHSTNDSPLEKKITSSHWRKRRTKLNGHQQS